MIETLHMTMEVLSGAKVEIFVFILAACLHYLIFAPRVLSKDRGGVLLQLTWSCLRIQFFVLLGWEEVSVEHPIWGTGCNGTRTELPSPGKACRIQAPI